jgi:hypothetical protein
MIEIISTIAGSGAFIAVVGWAYTLGNRVTKVETQHEGIEELINARFDAVEHRLERIERSMNGHLAKDEQ